MCRAKFKTQKRIWKRQIDSRASKEKILTSCSDGQGTPNSQTDTLVASGLPVSQIGQPSPNNLHRKVDHSDLVIWGEMESPPDDGFPPDWFLRVMPVEFFP